jgi:UrcA family protein
MSRTFKSALAIAALLAASPAALAEKPAVANATISYADLDLSRPAGVEALLERVSAASQRVCGKRPMTVRWGHLDRYLDCHEAAMSGAVRQIDVIAVTLAFDAGKAGRRSQVASR